MEFSGEFGETNTGGFQISLVKFGQICKKQQTYSISSKISLLYLIFYISIHKSYIFLCKKCVAVGYAVNFLTYPPREKDSCTHESHPITGKGFPVAGLEIHESVFKWELFDIDEDCY